MSDPVAWTLIERGWAVHASGGEEVGKVEEVAGDHTADIFDGLSIETHLTDAALYVPSEQVGTITDGRVDLLLSKDEVAQLDEYVEPAAQIEIEPVKAPLGTRLHQDVDNVLGSGDDPHELRAHRDSWLQRAYRRLVGK
jgi:hypothetical protein